ncbi:cell division protein FtsL [Rickettsia endosymbiont of Cardiosporidium cionae]|uniref:cell division protein FtsL n=1 Tax=Rickettsia endosymbiont of Cardiosporidium cionae TaxID=2777155 RepID=UPI001894BC40|nr:hypothetical protein [Rickettsia endosymbiont of Cardiosporidium cionae]KAF8818913.1 hypothetical protein IHI24_000147 [Rickettsia endosymbiont of Cardiosporidium cionae]
MLSKKILLIISITTSVIMSYMIFFIKSEVMTIKQEISIINQQILSEKDTINILNAELSYLITPERLRRLSNKYLALSAPNNLSQIISDPLSNNHIVTKNYRHIANKQNKKWRYKYPKDTSKLCISNKQNTKKCIQ